MALPWVFAKGGDPLFVSPGEGFGAGFACGWRGGGAPVETREKGKEKRKGGGCGGDRQRNRQVNAHALSTLPFSKLPKIVSPRCLQGKSAQKNPPGESRRIPGKILQNMYSLFAITYLPKLYFQIYFGTGIDTVTPRPPFSLSC